MKAAGVIVEFNPLHNGHIEHLHETRRITNREHIVAVMSGNFVQRGEPAICDKWQRTQMALLAGVDIVIELPVGYVVSGADYFARGAVKLLAATGIVDGLCFGCESGDLALINEAGRILALEPEEYKETLHGELHKGCSYAAARGAALGAVLGDVPPGLLTKPNNGLGIEYCKALWLMGRPIDVFASYRAEGGPSATAVRKLILSLQAGRSNPGSTPDCPVTSDAFRLAGARMGENSPEICCRSALDTLPHYVLKIIQEALEANELAQLDDYSDIFRYLLFTKDIDMGEGLENRFRRIAREGYRLTALLDAVKTKRYTYTRLQRAALGVILGMHPADLAAYEDAGGPAYIRVLGFRREAAGLLGEMTRCAVLPVITTGRAMDKLEGTAAAMLAQEIEAGDIYRLAFGGVVGYRHERGIPLVVV